MAYQYQQKEENDPNKKEPSQAGEQPGGGQNLVTSGGSSTLVGAGSSSGSPDTGSGWTNLQDYVAANEGESERGANRIVEDVSQQREDTTQAVTDFGNTEVSGFQEADDTFLDDLRSGQTGQGEQLGQLYGAGYQGPTNTQGVEGYDDLYGQVQDFQRTSDALDDPFQLTEEYNPGGNIGEKNLDRFFYQQRPAQDIFQKEFKAGDAVDDLWGQTTENLGGQIAADQAAYGQQQSDIKGAFDQGLAGLEGQFNPVYNQKYVDQQNADRQAEFNEFMKSGGKGHRTGDWEEIFGDQAGYNWDRMFDYTGDTTLGDYVDPTKVANYQNYLGEYGDTFGAQDRFANTDLTATGTRQHGAVTQADAGQRSALSELANLYQSRENDRSLEQSRYDELKAILGLEGFSDPRALPPPPPPPPAPPEPTPSPEFDPSTGADPEEGLLEQVFGEDWKKKAGKLLPG